MRFGQKHQKVSSADAALDFFIAPVSLWLLVAVAVGYLVEDGPVLGTRLMIVIIFLALAALGSTRGSGLTFQQTPSNRSYTANIAVESFTDARNCL